MQQLFYYKTRQILLQNASGFLFQNATVLFQNATVITNCDDFITKCDSYYKMQLLLEIATVQILIKNVEDQLLHFLKVLHVDILKLKT